MSIFANISIRYFISALRYFSEQISMKNKYYDRKVGESLEIDMAVVRYGRDKVLNRDNGNFVKTNAWKSLFF